MVLFQINWIIVETFIIPPAWRDICEYMFCDPKVCPDPNQISLLGHSSKGLLARIPPVMYRHRLPAAKSKPKIPFQKRTDLGEARLGGGWGWVFGALSRKAR